MTTITRFEQRPSLLAALPEANITEGDKYNPDPNRQRMFWLNAAVGQVDRVVGYAKEELESFPVKFAEVPHTGSEVDALLVSRFLLSSQTDQVSLALQAARAIAYKKGFRWGAALATPKDHKRIGSTIYKGYWELDHDKPLAIQRNELIEREGIELKGESFTIEEADRARRLADMTRLDLATGRVTDQKDEAAAANSYYFLDPEKIVAVKAEEAELQGQIDAIVPVALAEHMKTPQLLVTLERYMFGEVTTPEFNARLPIALSRYPEDFRFDIWESVANGRRIAFETGCWDFILTPQEILLMDGRDMDDHYKQKLYTPTGIQDGASADDIGLLRSGEVFYEATSGILGYQRPLNFRLEALTKDMQTAKSPTLLAEGNPAVSLETPKFIQYVAKEVSFPFSRPGEWHYKE